MTTPIHLSKKLEKLYLKHIKFDKFIFEPFLGKWNANLFYVDRKKCWLITNAETKFSLIIPDLKTSEIINFTDIFIENFYSQLIYENIIVDFNLLKNWTGNIELLTTDNDRKTIGTQNYILDTMEYWKHEFGNFQNMPFRELIRRMNSSPTKAFNWKTPREIILAKINTIAQQ